MTCHCPAIVLMQVSLHARRALESLSGEAHQQRRAAQRTLAAEPPPFSCSLLLRGLRPPQDIGAIEEYNNALELTARNNTKLLATLKVRTVLGALGRLACCSAWHFFSSAARAVHFHAGGVPATPGRQRIPLRPSRVWRAVSAGGAAAALRDAQRAGEPAL